MQVPLNPTPNISGAKQNLLSSDPILSNTYGRLIKLIKDSKGASINEQAIASILTAAFEQMAEEQQDKDTLIQELENNNIELVQKVQQIAQEHDILKDKFTTLQQTTQNLTDQYENLESQQFNTKRDNEQLKKETASLKQEYDDLTNQHHLLQLQYHQLGQDHDGLKGKADTLEKDFDTLNQEYCDLEQENVALKAEATVLTKKYHVLEVRYGALDGQTKDLQSNFKLLNNEYSKLHTFLNRVITNQTKMQAEMDAQIKRANELSEKFNTCYHVASFVGNQMFNAFFPPHLQKLYAYGKEYFSQMSGKEPAKKRFF